MKGLIKGGCLAIALILLLTAMPAASVASSQMSHAFVVNTSSLNLRSGPGLEYPVIGQAGRNEMVQVLGDAAIPGWYSVSLLPGGQVGFMDASFLSTAPQMVTPLPVVIDPPTTLQPLTGYSMSMRAAVRNPGSGQFLNLREHPSYNARVLGIYYNGTLLTVLSESGGWYYVQMDSGLRGYFRTEYISFDLSPPTPPSGGIIGTARITSSGGRVNLRQGPGYTYPVLASYYPGKTVSLYTNTGAFWQVSIDGLNGYIDKRYLTQDSGGTPSGTNARVKSGAKLNLRQQPNTASRVLGNFPGGTPVNVRRQGVEWSYVIVPSTGASGYFMTRYLTLSGLPEIPTKVVKHSSGSFVNLRGQASSSATVTTRVSHNSVVTVLVPMGEWSKVRFGSINGYMMSAFLK